MEGRLARAAPTSRNPISVFPSALRPFTNDVSIVGRGEVVNNLKKEGRLCE